MSKTTRDKWLKRLADEDKAHAVFRKRASDAETAYTDYDDKAVGPLFPVFPTTINLIHGRIYGQPPKPDVRKRHPSSPESQQQLQTPVPQPALGAPGAMGGTGAPGGGAPGAGQPPMGGGPAIPPPQPVDATADDNTIALCLERGIAYTIDTTLFDRDAHQAVNDFLLADLGIAKVEIESEVEMIPVIDQTTGQPMLDQDGQPLQQAQIVEQELHLRHFSWSRFRWEPKKDWRNVGWISFDHDLTKDDIKREFGKDIAAASSGSDGGKEGGKSVTGAKKLQMDKYEGTFTVHEIWDKRKKKRIWVTDAFPDLLDEENDPLELEDFYPCPAPMMRNVRGTELVPNPDHWLVARLAKHIDEIAERIYNITKQVKDIAFYDSALGEFKKIHEYPDGSMIAIQNLVERLKSQTGKADTDAVICQIDMAAKAAVLQQLHAELAATKAEFDEMMGMADIQRGVSNPNDTATAQNIKNQWADIRTGQRVQVVALFFRDVFRIMAQLISKHFTQQQIQAMSGIQLTPMQIATMRSDLAECYAVDVESDSTMTQDDAANQEQVATFVQAVTGYAKEIYPMVIKGYFPADLFKETVLLIKDAYKGGRQLEQAINGLPGTLQQLQQLTGQLEQSQQQIQQQQKQIQDMQNEVQQINMRKENRADFDSQVNAQDKVAHAKLDQERADVDALVAVSQVRQSAVDSARQHEQAAQNTVQKAQQAQQKAAPRVQ